MWPGPASPRGDRARMLQPGDVAVRAAGRQPSTNPVEVPYRRATVGRCGEMVTSMY